MSLVLTIVAFAGAIVWELVETRIDMLGQKSVRVAVRKSFGFWLVVAVICLILGGFWGYLLGGLLPPSDFFFDSDRPANGLILTAFFSGFGSIPALKGFKLLPIVNKVIGKISFDDTSLKKGKGVSGAIRLWWAL